MTKPTALFLSRFFFFGAVLALGAALFIVLTAQNVIGKAYADDIDNTKGGCTGADAVGWECASVAKGDDGNLVFDPFETPWIAFYSPDNFLVVAKYVGSGGDCDGPTGRAWDCMKVHNKSDRVLPGPSLAFDNLGKPWVAFPNLPGTEGFQVARFVGGNGDCDGPDGSAWDCMAVYDSQNVVSDTSSQPAIIGFDPSGTVWIVHSRHATFHPGVARYVGSGGNCRGNDGNLWECKYIGNQNQRADQGFSPSISLAFDKQGKPWVSYSARVPNYTTQIADTSLYVAHYVGSNGNCGATKSPSPSFGYGLNGEWDCMEIEQSFDAVSGKLAFDKTGNLWLVFGSTKLKAAKYLGASGNGDCTGADGTKWDCMEIDRGVSGYPLTGRSIAVDESGNPLIAYSRWASSPDLYVAQYIGSGGNCSGTEGASWKCMVIDSAGSKRTELNAIFDRQGNVWIMFADDTNKEIRIARKLAQGKTGLPLYPPFEISDGDLVREQAQSAIWLIKIINGKTFKRHILTDAFGNWYPHLSPFWDKIRVAPPGTLVAAQNSALIRLPLTEDPNTWRVFEVHSNGIVHLLCNAIPVSECNAFLISQGIDPDSIYTVNSVELAFYSHISDGALIRAQGGVDVWIVKYIDVKKFKRLILSPHVFNSYGHLRWDAILVVDPALLNIFVTSDLVRAAGDDRVWQLFPQGDTGERRWVASPEAFSRLGLEPDSIYEINAVDRDSYVEGQEIQ